MEVRLTSELDAATTAEFDKAIRRAVKLFRGRITVQLRKAPKSDGEQGVEYEFEALTRGSK